MLSRETLENLFVTKMRWGNIESHSSRSIFELLYQAGQHCTQESVVLDISAGQCRYKPFFQHANYIAVDNMAGSAKWDYSCLDVVGDACNLPIDDSSVDVCLNFTSLEHYSEPQKFFNEVARVLKSKGRLFLYVPCVIGEHQIPYDFFRYTRYGLAHLIRTSGLEIDFIRPSNAIFETALSLMLTAINCLPKGDQQDRARDVYSKVIKPVLTEAERMLPACVAYPEGSKYPQLPSAYCLCAYKGA